VQRNDGHLPDAACIIDPETGEVRGYHRVQVRLRNGWRSADPWPAGGGRPPTRWTLTGHPFDILEWEIAT
jgi:hypothetical protein